MRMIKKITNIKEVAVLVFLSKHMYFAVKKQSRYFEKKDRKAKRANLQYDDNKFY